MHALVAQLVRRPEHRLHDELRRYLAREAEQDPGLDHRLGEEREVGGTRAGDGRDGVHQLLGHAHDRAEMGERLLGERHVRVVGMRARAEPGDAFVDDRGRVRHRTADRDAVGARCRSIDHGRDRRGDGEDRLLGRDQVADLAEQRFDVLRLDGDDDECRARDGLAVRERRGDAVPLARAADALLATARGDDVSRRHASRTRAARRSGPRRSCRPRGLRSASRSRSRGQSSGVRRSRRRVRRRGSCAAACATELAVGAGDQPARPAEHEEEPCQPLPLLVRREQRGRLAGLDPLATE